MPILWGKCCIKQVSHKKRKDSSPAPWTSVIGMVEYIMAKLKTLSKLGLKPNIIQDTFYFFFIEYFKGFCLTFIYYVFNVR